MAGKKLLVADDSLTIQKVIRLALSNEGYEIQAVSDGNDAVQQISLFRPDIILIDVSLPGQSAFEVKRAINELPDLDEVRFVLMSSAFEKVDEAQATEVGFHGRLTKPFDPAHLRQVLTDVLAQVAAKRMEPTSLLQRPEEAADPVAVPAPGLSAMPPLPAETFNQPPPMAHGSPIAVPADEWVSTAPPSMPKPPGGPKAPTGLPLTPPPPADTDTRALWDSEPTLSLSAEGTPAIVPASTPSPAPVPPPLSAVPPAEESESDIKQLTESTMRMSGMDDFQWSVKEPSLKPLSNQLDAGSTTFNIEEAVTAPADLPPFQPEEPVAEVEITQPTIASLPPLPSNMKDAAPASDYYQKPGPQGGQIVPPPPSSPAMGAAGSPPEASVIGISQDQMEAIIRAQLQETFQKLAEKLLPDMAEKIIKQEIHRMLSEE